MRPLLGTLVVLLTLCATCAPAGGSSSSSGPRPDRNLLTREQLRASGYTTVYAAVEALRSNWLRAKGPDSFTNPTQVQVYIDDNQLGGVETLRAIQINSISWVRYYDGMTASARWGLGHGQGVIFVSTSPD